MSSALGYSAMKYWSSLTGEIVAMLNSGGLLKKRSYYIQVSSVL